MKLQCAMLVFGVTAIKAASDVDVKAALVCPTCQRSKSLRSFLPCWKDLAESVLVTHVHKNDCELPLRRFPEPSHMLMFGMLVFGKASCDSPDIVSGRE